MPASPSLARRMRVPSSTPAGMLTERVRSLATRPFPEQVEQGSDMIWPRPWQAGQVRSTVKKPDDDLTAPVPPQVGQALGIEPGLAPLPEQLSQACAVGTRICAVLPAKAS